LILKWRATEVEAICDEAAVAQTSQPLELAEALVKLRRQTSTAQPTTTVSGFVSGNVVTFEYRVNRLLELDSSYGLSAKRQLAGKVTGLLLVGALVTLFGIFVFSPLSIHHAAETLIEMLK